MIDRQMLLKELPKFKNGEQTLKGIQGKIHNIAPTMRTSILLRYQNNDLKIDEAITEIERFTR